MRALLDALRFSAIALVLTLLCSCAGKDKVLVLVSDNHPTLNLFGFEESELHHIHNTVDLHSSAFLVRYNPEEPNKLEWINCPIPVIYEYRPARGRRVESMYIRSFQDLQAKVPVNYARFAGYVKNGKALEFNYVTIGSYELFSDFRVPRDDTECAKATHYIVTLSVGAFNFSEEKAVEGGLAVEEKNTGIGVEASAGRGSGEATSMGDLEACSDTNAAFNDCFTPLQVMMMPLVDRHWSDTAISANEPPQPRPRPEQAQPSGAGQEAATQTQDLSLNVDESAWREGYYMADALQRLLIAASHVDMTSSFGFDDKGSTVAAGYLREGSPQQFNRPFTAGQTYGVIGRSALQGDINITVSDLNGNIVASDTATDSEPGFAFSVAQDGNYKVEMSIVGAQDDFGALAIMLDGEGGVPIEAPILQKVFQRLLDSGAFASARVQEMGFPAGLVFHPADWAVQGTILYPGEAIRQRGINFAGGNSVVFGAVSHDETMNIDLEVIDANSGETFADTEPDSNPIVIVDQPKSDTSYDLRVIFPKISEDATAGTLATSLILVVGD